jgi:hypothetical protein
VQQSIHILSIVIIVMLLITPQNAGAYIGPGAGIAAVGTVIALIGGIILAIVAFIWYPIKRLLAKINRKKENDR